MVSINKSEKEIKKDKNKSGYNDDFSKYLENLTNKTTVNGQDIKPFSWYKKILGKSPDFYILITGYSGLFDYLILLLREVLQSPI